MIAIIDYDAGNLKSVEKALQSIGEDTIVSRDREEILRADKVILPGVGSFGDAMKKLRDYKLDEVIKEVTESGKPFLGICLGLQLLFERSEETPGVEGLGILKGEILRIPDHEAEDSAYGMEFSGAYQSGQTVSESSGRSVCLFRALLLSESRGAGDRKGDYLVQHHDPCIGRKGKYFCMSVPSGEEQ